eukprot:COSAG03_NODE_22042_length_300_cov_0.639594_1_plen_60_part_01
MGRWLDREVLNYGLHGLPMSVATAQQGCLCLCPCVCLCLCLVLSALLRSCVPWCLPACLP